MRGIITADWHIRATRPRCRTDNDWMGTQRKALNQIVEVAKEKKCNVYCDGDIYHSNHDTSFECISMVQKFSDDLHSLNLSLGLLAGNHDLLYHSSANISKSAIGILLESYNISTIVNVIDDEKQNDISASNFDESDNLNAKFVFKHILCFPDVKSMPPNVDAITAKELLDEFPNAEWIFTGDYHHNFHYEKNGRHVVNPGCLLRQASDFKDYQCGVYYVDTEKNIVEFIPIMDSGEFVDDSYILKQEERENRIESFVDKLKNTKNISLDFVDNVHKAIIANKLDENMVRIIEELLEV